MALPSPPATAAVACCAAVVAAAALAYAPLLLSPVWATVASGPSHDPTAEDGDGNAVLARLTDASLVSSRGSSPLAWHFVWSWDDDGNFVDNDIIRAFDVRAMFTRAVVAVYEPLSLLAKATLVAAMGERVDPLAIRLLGWAAHAASCVVVCCATCALLRLCRERRQQPRQARKAVLATGTDADAHAGTAATAGSSVGGASESKLQSPVSHSASPSDKAAPASPPHHHERGPSARGTPATSDLRLDWLASAAATALYAAHPLCVETIAWPSCVPYTLAGLCTHAAVLCYIRALASRHGGDSGAETAQLRLSAAWYVAAVLFKSAALPLPAALVALEVAVCGGDGGGEGVGDGDGDGDGDDNTSKDAATTSGSSSSSSTAAADARLARHTLDSTRRLAPHFALAVALVLPTLYFNDDKAGSRSQVDFVLLSLPQRLVKAAVQPLFLLAKAVFPVGLRPHYAIPIGMLTPTALFDIDDHDNAGPSANAAAGVVCVSLAAVGALCCVARRHSQRALVCAVAYALLMMAPTLGLLQHGTVVLAADRYAYLPMAAAVPLLAAAVRVACAGGDCSDGDGSHGASAGAGAVVRRVLACVAAVTLVLALLSSRQSLRWRDNHTLWQYSLAVDGSDWRAHALYAEVLVREGNVATASLHLRRELDLLPPASWSAKAAMERAKVTHLLGDPSGACDITAWAAERFPDTGELLSNRGVCLLKEGRVEEAGAAFARAFALLPAHPQIARNAGEYEAYKAGGHVFKGAMLW